jgi:hypothetical protein
MRILKSFLVIAQVSVRRSYLQSSCAYQPKLPPEAIELYNYFIHGEIGRRAFIDGVQQLGGGLAAATVISASRPNYTLGQ